MVEKKTFGQKITNLIFVVILVILALSCLLPLIYNLAVSLSSKTAAEAGLVSFWPVDFTTNAYKEIMGEKSFFVSFWVSIKRVFFALITTSGADYGRLPACENNEGVPSTQCDYVGIPVLYAFLRWNDSMVYGDEIVWVNE